VRWTATTRGLRPQIGASCTASDASTAAPAVRIDRWVHAFGDHGILMPVCASTYGPGLSRLTELMNGSAPVLKP
jgi:hypothetical protein